MNQQKPAAPTQFKRLTFDGINDLYQTPYGAHTLEDYEALKRQRSELRVPSARAQLCQIETSAELEIRNERCIDLNGCSAF